MQTLKQFYNTADCRTSSTRSLLEAKSVVEAVITLTIFNNCTYTVWPAIQQITDAPALSYAGFILNMGDSKDIQIKAYWSVTVWGRTLCSGNPKTHSFICQTGDCGSGVLECSKPGVPPGTTIAELSIGGMDENDLYDISMVNGYNLPIMVTPQTNCPITGCIFDLQGGGCPAQLKPAVVNGTVVACNSACHVFGTGQYCCTSLSVCKPTNYSMIFKKACPLASSYLLDEASSTFSCKNSSAYTITFCPSSILKSAHSKAIAPSVPVISGPSASIAPSVPVISGPSASIAPSPVSVVPGGEGPPSTNLRKKKRLLRTLLLVVVPALAAISVLLYLTILVSVCKRKAMETLNVEETKEMKKSVESLQFDIRTIRTATRNFSVDNKLGQGGFGEVYKGKLENGQEIAVKRLLKNSEQGLEEFKTEIVLVAQLQHKNLVKLLGFCVAPNEKLLVYEFLLNSSLDRFLFEPNKKATLDWQTRFNIVIGIARGLLYLHEDSRIKVVHRDLKLSNILLDEAMNPKIADFGLARLFGVDETQGDTKTIVGTYGYMAPEYAITGHYSVKSDAYSFGVIVLEMVSGQRTRNFGRVQLEEALLHRAWRLWNENAALNLVDTELRNFSTEEVLKCIHVGLLCIQENAVDRPRITSIYAALTGQSVSLPTPKAPSFFGRSTNSEIAAQNAPPAAYTGTQTVSELSARD